MRWFVVVPLVLVVALVVLFKVRALMSTGRAVARFAPLPASPNCVSSEAPIEDGRRVEPLTFSKPTAEAKRAVMDELATMPRARLVTDDGNYLHYEFRSAFFGFIDDVELRFENGLAQIRSASRVGHSDLGVNRKRVDEIRRRLEGKI